VIALACELPAERGVPLSRWSSQELAREAVTRGIVEQISGVCRARGAAVAGAAGKALSDRGVIGPERSAQRGERLRAGQDRMQLDGITRHQAQAAAATDVGREQGRLDNLRHHQALAEAGGDTRRAHSLNRRAQASAQRVRPTPTAPSNASAPS